MDTEGERRLRRLFRHRDTVITMVASGLWCRLVTETGLTDRGFGVRVTSLEATLCNFPHRKPSGARVLAPTTGTTFRTSSGGRGGGALRVTLQRQTLVVQDPVV